MYLGDIRLGKTLYFKFTTRRFTTGVPYTLAGSPAVSVYEDDSTTEITAGITLTVDFDSRTGLNHVTLVCSGANGYESGKNYSVVVTAGTVDSVSIVGEVVAEFSVEARSAVMPTTADRTLDVSATGEAGVDWGNIGSPTTAVDLSGTTIKTATDVETDTANIQTRLPAALVSGRMDSSVGAMAANVLTASALATDAVDEIVDAVWDEALAGHTTAGTTGKALSDAGAAGDPWATALPGAYGAGTAGNIVGNNLDAAVSSRLAPTVASRTLDVTATGAAGIDWGNVENPATANNLSATNIDVDQVVASVSGAVGSVTGAVGSVTGNVGGNVVGSVDSVVDPVTVGTNNDKTGYALSAAAIQAIWDALTAALTTVGSIGKLLVDNINATISSRLASASITLTGGAVTVGTNNDKTGYSVGVGGIGATSFAANAIDSAAIANSAGEDIADRILGRNIAGGSNGGRDVTSALRPNRNRVTVTALGSVVVYEEDDTTPAWTGTATRDAAADPIVEVNPT